MNTSIQVVEVGSRWGVSCDGFIVKTFDTYADAVNHAAHVREVIS